jgi:hypothetical protein
VRAYQAGPLHHVVERRAGVDREKQENRLPLAEIIRGDPLESLLSGGVPDLQGVRGLIDDQLLPAIINPDRRRHSIAVEAIAKATNHGALADSHVADNNKGDQGRGILHFLARIRMSFGINMSNGRAFESGWSGWSGRS